MYCITDQQIEYILNDIRRNGVETEDLQFNLLDHICCILEQELKENDDFERFYKTTVRQFYKKDLREIEEETINLLTFKNYYAMRKLLIVSGAITALTFTAGCIFKTMHLPGAGLLLPIAILSLSLVFLPLMVLLKTKEAGNARDKLILAIAAITGISYSLSTLFVVQHWPGARLLLFATVGLAAFVLIPAYFFTGIRKPETKMNTIVTSVLLVGATGLLFTLIALRPLCVPKTQVVTYLKNETLLQHMQAKLPNTLKLNVEQQKLADEINSGCAEVKTVLLQNAAGITSLPGDANANNVVLNDGNLNSYFWNNAAAMSALAALKVAVANYNLTLSKTELRIPEDLAILTILPADKTDGYTNIAALNSITQVQMYLVNAQDGSRREKVALK
jgi:hypothetical protein